MKKYLPGMLVVLIALGLSAFTVTPKVKKTNLDSYFWYEIRNGVTVGDPVNSTVADQDDAREFINSCDQDDGTLCLAGFQSDAVTEGTAAPSPNTAHDNVLYKP